MKMSRFLCPNVFVFEEKHGSKRALWMPNPYVRNVKHHVQESESESKLKTAWYMLKQPWRPGKIVFRQHVKVPVPNVFDFQLLHFDLCLCCRQWSTKCFQAKSPRPRIETQQANTFGTMTWPCFRTLVLRPPNQKQHTTASSPGLADQSANFMWGSLPRRHQLGPFLKFGHLTQLVPETSGLVPEYL